jgi:hypothetical protein
MLGMEIQLHMNTAVGVASMLYFWCLLAAHAPAYKVHKAHMV